MEEYNPIDDIAAALPEPATATPTGVEPKPLDRARISFDPRLAFELALREEPVAVVLERYDVSIDDFKILKDHKPFLIAMKNFHQELKDGGVSFKIKAKLLAEDLLEEGYLMARNPAIAGTVRAKLIEDVVRWAELEPKKEAGGGDGNSFNIQINL